MGRRDPHASDSDPHKLANPTTQLPHVEDGECPVNPACGSWVSGLALIFHAAWEELPPYTNAWLVNLVDCRDLRWA